MKKLTSSKKNLIILILLTVCCLYSCKKDKFNEKPSAEEIAKAPEKFGYEILNDNTTGGFTKLEKQKLSKLNITLYYNSMDNSTLLINNGVIGNPNSGMGPTFEFNSSESILSGEMANEAPGLVDDTGELLLQGLINIEECQWVLYYGSITVAPPGGGWWIASDYGSFKLKSNDGNYHIRKMRMDSAIGVDPMGWIVETDRY